MDGELWAGRGRFEQAQSAAARQQPDDAAWRALRYMVFDVPAHPGTFDERLRALAGLVALSTYLPMGAEAARDALAAGASTQPVFMAHGVFDPVVPAAAGEAAARALEAMGIQVTWRRYPMPHAVLPEEIADLANWMGARLAG